MSANSKLKSLLAVRQLLYRVPRMCSRGQAQISAVAEGRWLCQISWKSCRSVPLGEQSPRALAKPKPALGRTSPRVFLHRSTGLGTGLQVHITRRRRHMGWGEQRGRLRVLFGGAGAERSCVRSVAIRSRWASNPGVSLCLGL